MGRNKMNGHSNNERSNKVSEDFIRRAEKRAGRILAKRFGVPVTVVFHQDRTWKDAHRGEGIIAVEDGDVVVDGHLLSVSILYFYTKGRDGWSFTGSRTEVDFDGEPVETRADISRIAALYAECEAKF